MISAVTKRKAGTRPTRVTMRMIAERAGVHVSTVSRALRVNGASGSEVGADVVTRIRAIADELGYRPDSLAASLRTNRTRAIGVLVPRLSDVVLATVYEGIEKAATRHGHQAVVSNTRDDPALQRRQLDLLLSRRVDGLILGDARLDTGILPEVSASGVPYVLVNRRADDHVSVTCDDVEGGRLVGQHLASRGHERVAIIAGPAYASTGADRTAGCRTALRERGITMAESAVAHAPFTVEGGRRAAEQLLALRPRPTAIFAVNDYCAIGVVGAARDHGLRVGSDLSIVGFNDIDVVAQLTVPLTTVHNPLEEMGRISLEMLLRAIGGEPPQSFRVQPTLVVRGSG